MPYAEGFKARMVERMAGPEGITATRLAEDVGVPQPTLSRWLREAPKVVAMVNKKKSRKSERPNRRTADEKLRIVLEAAQLKDEELGAYLRREGVHEAQLLEWQASVKAALSPKSKRASGKASPEAKRIRELEKDLRRKEKALAEVTALLALKKRIAEIWGDEDDDTPTRNET